MTTQTVPRGASTVGYLSELPPVEAVAVVYLRLWFSGPAHVVEEEFTRALGPQEGALRLSAFEKLMKLIATSARRPIMRHSVGCKCLGADECALAHAVAAAASGDRQDAMLFLAPLFPCQSCTSALEAVESVGLGISRMVAGFSAPYSATRH